MAKYSIEDTTLTNIADAIREKNGETTQYNPVDMPAAIAAIQGGGGSGEGLEREEITLGSSYVSGWLSDTTSSSVDYSWDAGYQTPYYPMFLKTLKYIDLKVTKLEELAYSATKITDHLKGMTITLTSSGIGSSAFYGCSNMTTLPEMSGILTASSAYFCSGCVRLVDASGLKNLRFSTTSTSAGSNGYGKQYFFNNCYSLRSIPSEFLLQAGRYPKAEYSSHSSSVRASQWFSAYTFYNCFALDEIVNFGVSTHNSTDSNFTHHLYHCGRLKRYTFETNEDGTPIATQAHDQTIDFSNYVGYLASADATKLQTYGGFTTDTQVTDDATYQALKDNPDYWTTDVNYARYNHDSAVETINSLPDNNASSYPNTIKFTGAAGALTDGGAINTLTEEEIAVATARGWTVTLA